MDLFFTKPSWIEHFFDILWWFHYRLYSRSTKDRRLEWKDGWTNRSSLVVKKHKLWIYLNDQLNCDCKDYSLEGLVPQGSALQQNIHNSLDETRLLDVFQVVHHDYLLGVDLENLLLFRWCFPLYMEFQLSNSSIWRKHAILRIHPGACVAICSPATKRNRMMLSIKDHLPIRSSADETRTKPTTKQNTIDENERRHHLEIRRTRFLSSDFL